MTAWSIDVQARLGALVLQVQLSGDDGPVALVGPNGVGKTTVLRLVAGAITPERGSIVVGDRRLFDGDAGIDIPPEARRVGYVPQGYGLFDHLRVIDNVAFGLSTGAHRRPRDERRQRARRTLEDLDCGHLADRRPATLSGGERQRVALARALAPDPDLLLLDEPLAATDLAARRTLRRRLAARMRGRAALVVTHDPRDIVALDAYVYVLDDGRIVQHGTAAQLRADPHNEFVAELFDRGDESGPNDAAPPS